VQCQVCSVKCAVKIVGCGVGIGGYRVWSVQYAA